MTEQKTYRIEFAHDGYSEDQEITVEALDADAAAESQTDALEDWIKDGNWGEFTSTIWINGYVRAYQLNADGEEIEDDDEGSASITVEFDPAEPDCINGEEHDWQAPIELVGGIESNPGVQANGGGVICTEVCVRCGCGKTRDSWAQNPSNGVQGLNSIEFKAGEYLDELSEYLEDLDVGDLDQTPIGEGGNWSVFLAHKWGHSAVVVTDENDSVDVEWYDTQDEAMSEAKDAVDNLRDSEEIAAEEGA